MNKKILKLLISIIISHSAGIIGSFFTVGSIDTWYQFIEKPIFNPPSWVFGPAWLTLYTLMGIALYFVWSFDKAQDKQLKKRVQFAFMFFIVHLVVNASWSIVFFGLQNIFLALVVIVVLWCMILASIILFWRIDKRAAYLLVPYLLWVSFATLLNYSIWQLNV